MIKTDFKPRIKKKIELNFTRRETRDIDPLNAMTGVHSGRWAPGLLLRVRHVNLAFQTECLIPICLVPESKKKETSLLCTIKVSVTLKNL